MEQLLNSLSVVDKQHLTEACWYLEDAFIGESRPHPEHSPWCIRLYKWYTKMFYVRRLAVVVCLMLSFIEIPFWCTQPGRFPCGDPSKDSTPITFGIPYIPSGTSMVVEGPCLLLVWITSLMCCFSLKNQWWSRRDR